MDTNLGGLNSAGRKKIPRWLGMGMFNVIGALF